MPIASIINLTVIFGTIALALGAVLVRMT